MPFEILPIFRNFYALSTKRHSVKGKIKAALLLIRCLAPKQSMLCHLLWMSFLVSFMTSCATRYEFIENPPPLSPVRSCATPIRVALVLGGGGARGMAHVGVIEELEKADIPIDVIVGCSAGSIVGALYADCPNVHRLRRILEPLRKWDILDISILHCRYGLVQGRSLRNFLCRNLHHKRFEELRIPLYVVATDLRSGELVCLSHGNIIPAIHASSSIPFVFAPVLLNGRILVDGGVADPVPACVARELEADIVVAVDLCELLPKTCPTNLFGVATRCAEIKFQKHSEICVQRADVIIRPEIGELSTFDDQNHEKMYQAGRQAALQAIPAIKELLERHGWVGELEDYHQNENDICKEGLVINLD